MAGLRRINRRHGVYHTGNQMEKLWRDYDTCATCGAAAGMTCVKPVKPDSQLAQRYGSAPHRPVKRAHAGRPKVKRGESRG